MLSLLLSLVVLVIVAGLLYWAIGALAAAFGLPAQVTTVLQVLLVIVIVIVLISWILPGVRLAVH